ncbi:MAG TPA: DUF1016 domain-containing protein [Nitrospirae bacterium]|nr:hypothetical protein BMS3Abin06_01140 [bacterium BMS3Abin06]HDH11157.1 DUF1016 domain-containing protein [Nitrospirota bacterium]HDZ02636.1 DUF1016 domain-containing protein [Nitrospirota bacterium]
MKKISRGGKSLVPIKSKLPKAQTELLISDIRSFIEQSRYSVSRAVNAELSMLYWNIGQRIRKNVLKEKRASYGKEILSTLSIKLVEEYGAGFSQANLFRMVRFAEVFPNEKIVTTLSAQLGWSHFVEIIALSKGLQREFYAEMCRVERWSVRQLREKVRSMLYERTALSKKPEKLIKQELDALREENKLTPDLVFRDPYILDFLRLKDSYSEKDLEAAILREMESFILELGAGFSFIARQKRMTVDAEDYYLDLLFFHRALRRLVAIELKLDRFRSAHKGQMELYLRWLDKYELRGVWPAHFTKRPVPSIT